MSSHAYLAPGAGFAHAIRLPGDGMRPGIEDHMVPGETREELIDGRVMQTLPAHPPHADRHAELDYVLRANAAAGYVSSSDLLTRTSENWDFAADAAIRKDGNDPETGGRYLEELAFEIKHTQRMGDLTRRARELVGRGVRRVFVICVDRDEPGPVLEWSGGAAAPGAANDGWVELDPDGFIEDPCLQTPVAVRALLDASAADNAVARALRAKNNPVLQEIKAEGLRQAVLDLCELLELEVTPARRARLEAMDVDALNRMREALKAQRHWPAWATGAGQQDGQAGE
jgi:hypothetical protein